MKLALMDCNNFYASCERAFAPHLAGRPVVVLSNNDGCVIARSQEAKDLGVPMGAPEFKCRALFKRHGVAVFSSNYALYGDMSARVMAVAGGISPRMEVYSIDEAFLDLTGLERPEGHARQVRETVKRCTGIPVSIGIGPTKTLAKLANRLAKKDAALEGVLDLPEGPGREELLARMEIRDVWGIGPRHGKRLIERGVRTALDFCRLPRESVLKSMTVTGLHTWLELRGVPCISLDGVAKSKKAIVSSRSFGRPVESIEDLREALSHYAALAAGKLRAQKGQAASLQVWLETNSFVVDDPQYTAGLNVGLNPPTAHTTRIVRAALDVLERLYRPGFRYKKAGVMLTGIEAAATAQLSLLDEPDAQDGDAGRGGRLMEALDRVNARWGRDTLFPASAGIARPWDMRQMHRSPRYTTSWTELPVVRA